MSAYLGTKVAMATTNKQISHKIINKNTVYVLTKKRYKYLVKCNFCDQNDCVVCCPVP